jgi:hypothetical protein
MRCLAAPKKWKTEGRRRRSKDFNRHSSHSKSKEKPPPQGRVVPASKRRRLGRPLPLMPQDRHLALAHRDTDGMVDCHSLESGISCAACSEYERLAYDTEVDSIDLGAYLREVCADAVSGNSPSMPFPVAPIIASGYTLSDRTRILF